SEEYGNKRDQVVKAVGKQRDTVLERLGQRAAKAGFDIQATPFGIVMIPVRNGRPLGDAELAVLPAAVREELKHRQERLQDDLKAAMKDVRKLERAGQEKLQELDRQAALYIVEGLMDDLNEQHRDLPEVTAHLKAVQQDMLQNIETFKASAASPGRAGGPGPEAAAAVAPWLLELPFRKYQVNVLVDNSQREGRPVVVEINPNYYNLSGRIEKETQFGALYTDFTMIKAGALHKANGGYLVVRVEDLLSNVMSWDNLKCALRSNEIQIEDLGERMGFMATKSLRPQPIPLEVKVVLVGRPLLYYLLHSLDDEFPELFKVKADFDSRMERSRESVKDFLRFLCAFCKKESLKPLDAEAVAKLLEHGSRLADDQEKLSTHFGNLADLVREAHFWALQDKSRHITAAHVARALKEKIYRSNLIQERIQEMITRGTLLIATEGEAIGQVNGLSVISLGDYVFGRPSRITASVGPGREGIIDLERQVELGGPIHSKGVLILGGYLTQKYAQDMPLTLAARLVFEQSYEGVEGDSASSAELYAVLSALAGAPIKQGIAVTGSVNQRGEIQAIGGANQKIEGFFDVCKAKGLTGQQGVMLPRSNVQNLMLREDVVEAVRAGKFHVWAVTTVDEGIEVLTGVPAGQRRPDGAYPEDAIHRRVEQRLREFAQCLKEFPEAPAKLGQGKKHKARPAKK
ncbi:MAG: ATP-binding protein, partial [Chloroflexota bacterium]